MEAITTTIEPTDLATTLPPAIDASIRLIIKHTKIDTAQAAAVIETFTAEFEPFLHFKADAEAIIVTDASQTDLIARAREIDTVLLKVDQRLTEVHKAEKERYLRPSQLVDGIRRTYSNAIADVRSHLRKQIDYVRNLENDRLNKQEAERMVKLAEFGLTPASYTVRTIPDDQFELMLAGAKVEFEKRLEAERVEREEREILREQNDRLTRERNEAEAKATAERLERERLEREKQAEIDRVAREKAEEDRQIAAAAEAKRLAPDKEKLGTYFKEIQVVISDRPSVESAEAMQTLGAFFNEITSLMDRYAAMVAGPTPPGGSEPPF